MSRHEFTNGVNCTMLAPYTLENKIDFHALEHMLAWYIRRGCSSIFAMCHSTELHLLSPEERLSIIRFVSENTRDQKTIRGRQPDIVAAGTFSTDLSEMADEVVSVREAGADAVVIITNRLDPDKKGDGFWRENAERLIEKIPADIPLGLYECPMPYKRILTDEDVAWALNTGRFYFIKDTCCDLERLRRRCAIVRNSQLKLFNANAQTLLASLRAGASGYSSVMANIHPELYAWLCDWYEEYPGLADHLQHILCYTAFSESMAYPITARYVMRREGVPVELKSRMRNAEDFTYTQAHIMDQLMELTKYEYQRLPHRIEGLWDDGKI